ncbi:MAG: HepT-like ribonuclease domain-containing protein [Melioribacteraceae bacterium]|nr:HepT-like ribonuclease domain-containing protein [Melioribacteraceae bacterium]
MSNEKLKDLFDDVYESIEIIIKRTENVVSAEEFVTNDAGLEKLDAVSMRLQIIGETLKKIESETEGFLNNYKDIEWNKIIKMREIISHHYSDIDAEIIFDIIKNHIPPLKHTITNIISDLNKEN